MLIVLFALIMVVWLICGFRGIIHCRKNGVNWEMIIFMVIFPFLPLIMRWCALI